jgi:XapX domain-containing protein
MKLLVGFVLAFAIGASCRWFDLPAPSPPRLIGALLVFTMTAGYAVTDRWLAKAAAQRTTTANTITPADAGGSSTRPPEPR